MRPLHAPETVVVHHHVIYGGMFVLARIALSAGDVSVVGAQRPLARHADGEGREPCQRRGLNHHSPTKSGSVMSRRCGSRVGDEFVVDSVAQFYSSGAA